MIDTAYINFTILCNYQCSHCYTGISGPIRRPGELTKNKMKELLNKLKDNNIKSVVIVGGEPMLRRDFIELLVVSSLLFKSVTVETNGSIFKAYLIEIIKEYELNNITFWTSIEGATEEENSIIRGPDALENSILFIKKLKNASIPIGIRSTLYNERIDYKKVVKLAEKLGVQVTFVRFLPVGRGKELSIAPDKERIAEAYESTFELNKQKRIDVKTGAATYLSGLFAALGTDDMSKMSWDVKKILVRVFGANQGSDDSIIIKNNSEQ